MQRRPSRSSSRNRASSEPGLGSIVADSYVYKIESNPQCNGGLKNAIDSVGNKLRKKLWIGTLGSALADVDRGELKQGISSKLRGEHESEVVWIDHGVFERMYDGFCHQVLWPALHYAVPDAPKTKLFYESGHWPDYVAVNRLFAKKIAEIWREGDIVWVNDYHLMLLPAMLRAEGGIPASAPIGFFLHVAFPSSEIFRCLSVRESLLRGILGSDLVGFQTASFARHFRQTVSRILSVETFPRGIQLSGEFDSNFDASLQSSRVRLFDSTSVSSVSRGGRFVDVGVFPMGIDVWQLKEKMHSPDVAEWTAILRQRYAGKRLLVGRDKLDDIQGVRQKIQAFEIFLDKHQEYVGKVVLIQVALPSSATAPTQNLYAIPPSILTPLSHINSKYSTLTYQPVVFLHTQDVSFSQYLALMKVADGFIVTSLREGMALRTHEFVISQENIKNTDQKPREGVLILSEFTGSYSYSGFRSCIPVNPWDARGTADAIYQALTMSDVEAHSRWEDLNNHVNAQTAQAFVTSFLTRCLRASAEHQDRYSNGNPTRGRPSFGATETREPVEPQARVLNDNLGIIMGRWRHSQRRLIIVDWEGTLIGNDQDAPSVAFANFSTHSSSNTISDATFDAAIGILQKLSDNKRNEVWLLSGLSINGLRRIAEAVPKVGIVAENGCFIKPRQSRSTPNPDWINMVPNLNMAWKSPCLTSLNYFTERSPGSFIEEREASVVWQFWNGPDDDSSDRQWAKRQAAEAQNHVFDSLGERYGLRIIPGPNSFLILPNNISRSTAVGTILQLGSQTHSPVAGSPSITVKSTPWAALELDDGVTDEEFEIILAISADEKLLRRLNELDNSETVSIRGQGTDAKWVLKPLSQISGILGKLAEV